MRVVHYTLAGYNVQEDEADAEHRVVIIGGGFGGLYCARSLRKAPLRLTLVDRRNFHLFQPLLYQVANGGLSPANIAAPCGRCLSGKRTRRSCWPKRLASTWPRVECC